MMMSLNETFRLKYTNFVLTNYSVLDKEEKIKIIYAIFHFYFYLTFGKIG